MSVSKVVVKLVLTCGYTAGSGVLGQRLYTCEVMSGDLGMGIRGKPEKVLKGKRVKEETNRAKRRLFMGTRRSKEGEMWDMF